MENGQMVQMILCVGLKGEPLEFQIGVGDLGWGGRGRRGRNDFLGEKPVEIGRAA